MHSVLGLLLAAGCAAGVHAASPLAELEAATQRTVLPNGLRVIVAERPGTTVAVQLYCDAGVAHETPGSTGISHVLRHLWNQQARAAGWNARGNARLDANTFFTHELPVADLPRYLAFERDRIAQPDFQAFEEARKRAITDRDMRAPAWLLEEVTQVAMTAHPVRTPSFGFPGDLERLTVDDVRAYWKRFFVPANLILTVVGPVKSREVTELARTHLGGWERMPKPTEIRAIEPPQRAERRIVAEPGDRGVVIMSFHKAGVDHPSYAVWDVLAPLLGERLKRAVVDESKLADRVHVGIEAAGMKYPGLAQVIAFLKADVDAAAAEKAIDAQLARLANEPATGEEIDRARAATVWKGDGPNHAIAADLADWEAMTGDYRNIFRHPARVHAVGAKDVQTLAATVFQRSNRTVAGVSAVSKKP